MYRYRSILMGKQMSITFKRSVFKSGDSYRVTIPMPIIEALNIKEKEELKIWLDTDGRIILEKMQSPKTSTE